MRKWRGPFNFGQCTPKMMTSDDDDDDDDDLYVSEGILEENTLSFLAFSELRGTPLSSYLAKINV